jgi:hypothetical protein
VPNDVASAVGHVLVMMSRPSADLHPWGKLRQWTACDIPAWTESSVRGA